MTQPVRALAVLAATVSMGSGAAGSPASAIPWLTESLGKDAPVAAPFLANTVIVERSVGKPVRDGIGVLTSQMTGMPRDLWRGMTVDDATDAIAAIETTGPPATTALFQRLLMAETDPPAGAQAASTFLTARIDRLLGMGALLQAEALIEAAQPDTAALFRRWFDVEILTGHGERACDALLATPMLAPATPVRIYCLARTGDWDAAGIALMVAERIGDISGDEAALFALFVDPALMEGVEPPPPSSPIRALEFVVREATGLPVSRADLPFAFIHMDMRRHVPIRFRMQAAERLVAAGVVDPKVLFSFYRAEVPAASGGVWDRAAAVQAFDAATTPKALGPALVALDRALAPIGLRAAAAAALAERLSGVDPGFLASDERQLAARYLLLGGENPGPGWVTGSDPASLRAAAIVRGAAIELPSDLEGTSYWALAPFLTATPLEFVGARERLLIRNNEVGAAILRGIDLLSGANARDGNDMAAALALLRLAGQDETARSASVELLLLNDGDGP